MTQADCVQRFERVVEKASALVRGVWFSDEGRYGQSFTLEQFRTAVSSPYLRRFDLVSVYKAPVGIEGWEALAASPHLTGLAHLNLGRSCTATRGAVRVLADTPVFAGVRALGLECWTMRVESSVRRREYLHALTHMDNFRGLEAVDLSTSRSRHLAGVAVASEWRLKQLFLADNDLGEREAAVIAEANHLAELSVLDLSMNRVGDGGAVTLARSQVTAGLSVLNLSNNRIGDRGAIALAESEGLEGVRKLDLSRNPTSPRGIEALRARFGARVHLGVAGSVFAGESE